MSTDSGVVVGYMALNFITSVAIIWANKLAYNSGFPFATTLTVIHFLFTFVGLEISARRGLFEKKPLSVLSVAPISCAFCGFVVFNNLSLQHNAIGTYQLMKVMTTPAIVAIQYAWYGVRLPMLQAVSLLPVCVGVCLATVASLDASWKGLVFGVAGIVSTSIYQIWVKTEQANLECSSEQLLYYQAPVSGVMLLLTLPFVEDLPSFLTFEWLSFASVFWVLFSALSAFLVNLSIFLVIGKTSPVSYNVLGHGKLCVILLSGYLLFGDAYTAKNLIGVLMAVVGIVWYTHLKLAGTSKPAVKAVAKDDEMDRLTSADAAEVMGGEEKE